MRTREDDLGGVSAVLPGRKPLAPENKSNGDGRDMARPGDAGYSGKGEELMNMTFPPIKEIAPGYLVEGSTLLAGRPKAGKSWFALDCSIAVANGTEFLGSFCKKGDVLFIALEDDRRRLRDRMIKILGPGKPGPRNWEYWTACPRANEGGLDKIRAWIASKETPRLVVIDVLTAFRSLPGRKDASNIFAADYAAIQALREIALESNVAILIIHHTKKGASDFDPVEQISGSNGLGAAADAFLVLSKSASGQLFAGAAGISRRLIKLFVLTGKHAAGKRSAKPAKSGSQSIAKGFWTPCLHRKA